MNEQPWIEKYRPDKIDDVVLTPTNKTILNNMISNDIFSNLILRGPPGTGKTTTIICLMNDYCKKHNCSNNYIHLNVLMNVELKSYAIKYLIFQIKTICLIILKFVLLDEVDSMTKQAQNNLSTIILNCKNEVSFILICNFLNRVIVSLRTPFTILHFSKTTNICDKFIRKCIKNENVKISEERKYSSLKRSNSHDLRGVLNQLQNYNKGDFFFDDKMFEALLNPQKIINTWKNSQKPWISNQYSHFFLLNCMKNMANTLTSCNIKYETIACD